MTSWVKSKPTEKQPVNGGKAALLPDGKLVMLGIDYVKAEDKYVLVRIVYDKQTLVAYDEWGCDDKLDAELRFQQQAADYIFDRQEVKGV